MSEHENVANLATHTRQSAEDQARELLAKTQRVGSQSRPEWIRCPKTGRCQWTGLSRGKMYSLKWGGKIRSVSLREPGRKHGVRLFHLQSILDYIAGVEAQAEQTEAEQTATAN
jgi:hypothetical protein